VQSELKAFMPEKETLIGLHVTPEMQQRLTQLTKDMLQLLQDRAKSPEEAFIVLNAAKRSLEATYGMILMAPIDDQHTGQA
jgi:hypothetical protein